LRAIRDEATELEKNHTADELKVWGDTIPNWVTAVVTTVGVVGAIYTIVLLFRQTQAARRAADMANRSNVAAQAFKWPRPRPTSCACSPPR
jgi:hypothetical protein